ncbi:MAG: hypothetical protein IT430_09850 [Phycisphaerales bacterium]|nr:hypothetical protein [Phycisphaerales bacterium]
MATPFSDALNTIFGANLVRHWKMWETSGTVADDATDNVDANYVSGPTINQTPLSADAGAKSVLLDGVDDAVRQATGGIFGATTGAEWTCGVLFNSSDAAQFAAIISMGRTNTSFGHMMLYVQDGDLKLGYCNTDGTSWTTQFNCTVDVCDGQTHLLTFTKTTNIENRVYADNDKTSSTLGTGNPVDNSNFRMFVGEPTRALAIGPTDRFDGKVEQFFFANQAITDEQVATLVTAITPASGQPARKRWGGINYAAAGQRGVW